MTNEEIAQRIKNNRYRLKDRKIALYPYGKNAKKAEHVLWEEFGLKTEVRVDNYASNPTVINFQEFMKEYDKETILIFTASDLRIYNELLCEIYERGVNAKDILLLNQGHLRGYEALEKIINLGGVTVLDCRTKEGVQDWFMRDYGKKVTSLVSKEDEGNEGRCSERLIWEEIHHCSLEETFDIVWLPCMLEHIVDVEEYLIRLKKYIKPNGCLAISELTGQPMSMGMVHTFTPGHLLRALICAGYDCRNAQILQYYGYVSVVLPQVKEIESYYEKERSVYKYTHTAGKDNVFAEHLPTGLEVIKTGRTAYFVDDIRELNWNKSKHKIML